MSQTIQERYINPIYLKVLKNNFLGLKQPKLSRFVDSTTDALESVTDKELIYMYQCGGWRESMVASWLVGIGGFSQHLDRIGDLLCNHGGYADQFHCFALARFATEEAIAMLNHYLEKRLGDTHPANAYWTSWRYFHAFGALKWLDKQNGTAYANRYQMDLESRIHIGQGSPYSPNFDDASTQLQKVMDFVDEHFPLTRES